MKNQCPYCGKVQNPPPQRKRKCRDCGEPIYIQRDGDERTLITEQEHDRIQRKVRDQYWKELSRQTQQALRPGDWDAAGMAYWQQAGVLHAEGRDNRQVLEESFRCRLRQMEKSEIKRVEVSTSQDEGVCVGCRAVDGQKYGIGEAMRTMPLPGDHCEMCRCVYTAVFGSSKSKSPTKPKSSPRARSQAPDRDMEPQAMTRIEQINAQLKRTELFRPRRVRKETALLPAILEDDEEIKGSAYGMMENKSWFVLCTDRRLLMMDKGLFRLRQKDIPLEAISSVTYETGLMSGTVAVIGSGFSGMVVKRMLKQEASRLARAIQQARQEHTERR